MNIEQYVKEADSKQLKEVMNTLYNCLDNKLSLLDKDKLLKKIHYIIYGGHFNRELADEQISKMNHPGIGKGPYYTWNEIDNYYDKRKIPDYNVYDFGVTLNMVTSDYYQLLHNWFKEEKLTKKYVDLAYNWLQDDDNPYDNEKIWKYFNK